jgi:hypothetical protein
MKSLATVTSLAILLAACAGSPDRADVAPLNTASPVESAAVNGTWDFVVTGKDEPQRFSFDLTDSPADTCLSGNWYQARPLEAPRDQVSKPAYRFESGQLEILLSTELCDAYTSLIGTVTGSRFQGAHVSYGLFGSTEHGKVRGAQRP